jgi:hypothetical protein
MSNGNDLDIGVAAAESSSLSIYSDPFLAVVRGDKEKLQSLVGDGANINARYAEGRTPLSFAAELGREDMVELLLEQSEIDVDSKDDKGRSPLWWACSKGREKVISQLLSKSSANVFSKDMSGQAELWDAVQNGDSQTLITCLHKVLVEQWWSSAASSLEIGFKRKTRTQNEEESLRGRAAVLTFLNGHAKLTRWGSPEDLRRDILECQIIHPVLEQHRLVILEDLGRNWIEVLGPILQIPVYFFALHQASPTDHFFGRVHTPIGQPTYRHFILSYKQPLPFRLKKIKGSYPNFPLA